MEIEDLFKELIRLYNIMYDKLKPEVEYIISNNIRDIKYIERILEELLNTPYEPCYKLFIRLCNYVSSFDEEIAKDYLELYDELYGEEEKKKNKH